MISIMPIPTGRMDKNGLPLFVGDKIRVPDNPDIVPYDHGIIKQGREGEFGYDGFWFSGQVGMFPLSCYEDFEIEKLDDNFDFNTLRQPRIIK